MTCTICSSPDHSRSNCPMRCTHCHRTLRREPVQVDGRSYGPTCARNLFGRSEKSAKAPRIKIARPFGDELTMELFA